MVNVLHVKASAAIETKGYKNKVSGNMKLL